DSLSRLAKFVEQEGLTFPLLSNPDRSVLTSYGAFGEKKNYGRIVQGVIRSTFVVSSGLTVERAYYNVRATGHVDRLRRDLGL
ncbi:MAG TPA: redoxin domain-containing protein, partial [Thermobifida alba]|nr:redoxin domain-containing protein [Thermobifida alba]